jgi:hypothetical protein
MTLEESQQLSVVGYDTSTNFIERQVWPRFQYLRFCSLYRLARQSATAIFDAAVPSIPAAFILSVHSGIVSHSSSLMNEGDGSSRSTWLS